MNVDYSRFTLEQSNEKTISSKRKYSMYFVVINVTGIFPSLFVHAVVHPPKPSDYLFENRLWHASTFLLNEVVSQSWLKEDRKGI